MRIKKLDPYLANQLAAGEVIERPASVLKELLENSIDAGSTCIEILIEGGGIPYMSVVDNGCGIHPDDLCLALDAQATSKIQGIDDLMQMYTLGFRGEALASMAAVSRLTLTSRIASESIGWSISTEGDQIRPRQPIAHPVGTRIEIRDLFYHLPARRKFLRSEKTEYLAIEEVFKRIALSHFEIEFRLSKNGILLKQLPRCMTSEARAQRVATVCGPKFIEYAQYMCSEEGEVQCSGWIGTAQALRRQTDIQYMYVNGRSVKDKLLSHALRQAYETICPIGYYPAYVIYLTLPPDTIDVNVHPTKHEVRFREARQIHAFLASHVRQNLGNITEIVQKSPEMSDHDETNIRKTDPFFSPYRVQILCEGQLWWIESLHSDELWIMKAGEAYALWLNDPAWTADQAVPLMVNPIKIFQALQERGVVFKKFSKTQIFTQLIGV
jgi:DNA mismatch repair protein MutL